MGKRSNKKPNIQPKLEEHIDGSEDEEIDEDEAFNSEDEAKYGSFFSRDDDEDNSGASDGSSQSEDDEGSMSDDDDDLEEGDGGQYMLDLLAKLDEGKDKKNDTEKAFAPSHVNESEFASSVGKIGDLTLDLLMDGIKDTKGFGAMQRTMKKVVQGKATSAPAARLISARMERKIHYEDQTKEISQWVDAVQQNRQAETLDFRPKDRVDMTKDILVDKFVPTTDFEKQLQKALEEAGHQDEEAIFKAEEKALQDDLGTNQITMEEYKQRRGQLAKMRALMFYHEQKRHHINKIKSKKYRRIRKKQRDRQKESETDARAEEDPHIAKEMEEKEELDRMKERASLSHKNTSKWAKRVLRRGKNVDLDTRRALSAQLKRGDDLLQRMQATRKGDDSDDDSEGDLLETARKVLEETERDGDDPIQSKGIFKLSFMQKGVEKQRERAKEEARQLLMELQENEQLQADEDDKDIDEIKEKKKGKVASKEEMKSVLMDGELVASSLKFGNSNSLSVSGDIELDLKLPSKNQTVGQYTTTIAVTNEDATHLKVSEKDHVRHSSKKAKKTSPIARAEVDSNPWLIQEDVVPPKTETTAKQSSQKGVVDIDNAVTMLDGSSAKSPSNRTSSEVLGTHTDTQKITSLTQEELVKRAFATMSEQEAQEEFDKEKGEIRDREDPTRKRKLETELATSRGWGSWVGAGAPPPKPPRKALPKHLQPPELKLPKRQRVDDKKAQVILSERRVKKTADVFMISEIPYPYSSREEYERAMAGGLGKEWNVTGGVKDLTRPEILTRVGKIIQPLSVKVKTKRAPAKF